MFRFGKLCLILCLGWQYAASSPITVTEYEYVREADAWLRLHIVPATWSDAAVICQLEGGVLATPTTSAIVQVMKNSMDKHKITTNFIYIGATSLFSKGDFKSLDGDDLADSLEWAGGEPDNYANAEACLAMTDGRIADVSCTRVLPYFCRKTTHDCSSNDPTSTGSYDDPNNHVELSTARAAPKCHSTLYEWSPLTGSCYRFYREAKSWRQALATCRAEGGHLAIINSDTESSVLREIFEKNPGYAILGTDGEFHATDYALIGFVDSEANGDRLTIDGETLVAAGFDKWTRGEPNNLGVENCGSMHRDGLLNDISCFRKFPFICESTPKIRQILRVSDRYDW